MSKWKADFSDPKFRLTPEQWKTCVGLPVCVKELGKGTLEYYGADDDSDGTVVCGVILRDPKGNSDGTLPGQPYTKVFHCNPARGVFVLPEEVILLEHWNHALAEVEKERRIKAKKKTSMTGAPTTRKSLGNTSSGRSTPTTRTKRSSATPDSMGRSKRTSGTPDSLRKTVVVTKSKSNRTSVDRIRSSSRTSTGSLGRSVDGENDASTERSRPFTTSRGSIERSVSDQTGGSSKRDSNPRRKISQAPISQLMSPMGENSLSEVLEEDGDLFEEDVTKSAPDTRPRSSRSSRSNPSPSKIPICKSSPRPSPSPRRSKTGRASTDPNDSLPPTPNTSLISQASPSPVRSSSRRSMGVARAQSDTTGSSTTIRRSRHSAAAVVPNIRRNNGKDLWEGVDIGEGSKLTSRSSSRASASADISVSTWKYGSVEKTRIQQEKEEIARRLAIEQEVRRQDDAEMWGEVLSSTEADARGTLTELEKKWAEEDAAREAKRQAEKAKRQQEEIERALKFEQMRAEHFQLLSAATIAPVSPSLPRRPASTTPAADTAATLSELDLNANNGVQNSPVRRRSSSACDDYSLQTSRRRNSTSSPRLPRKTKEQRLSQAKLQAQEIIDRVKGKTPEVGSSAIAVSIH